MYDSVTEYVRLGYNQAMRQNRQYLDFLMILMQRLVTSSTQAIASAMERRLEALQSTNVTSTDEEPPDDDLTEQDSQEQLEELLATRLAGLQNEKEEVRLLLDLARRCQAQGPDARAETLLAILYENQRDENNPELKYLIFTEFVPTQNMLREFLEQHGFSVVCLNGSMDLEERRRVQQQFAEKARILVSTDAGGEGLNLQFAHIVVNYDLPWNPMKIEQRIGRVDRIGRNFSRSFSCGWRQGMANWRDNILKHFQPKISRLTLVADPDGLLTEEGMLSAIRERGFDLIPFDDPIAFRFAYESQYRSLWDQGQKTDLVVLLRSADLQLWLLEALLGASAADEIEAQQLLRLPESFPFTLSIGIADLRKHEGFNIHRQGLDMDMVALRKVRVEQPAKPAQKPRKAKAKKAGAANPSLFDRQPDEVSAANVQQRTLADAPFAAPIAECVELVREGRFYAGMALAQAVVEAAVLLVWRVKFRKRKNQKTDFVKAVEALHTNSLIGDDCKAGIERMWADRHAVLLRPSVDPDRHLLEEAARTSLGLMNDLAREFFGYSQRDGVIVPDYPEYWSASEEETPVLAGG